MIQHYFKLFVLLFFLIVVKSIACNGQYFLLYKSGAIKQQDSLMAKNGNVFLYQSGSLHDLPLQKLDFILLNDSVIQVSKPDSLHPNNFEFIGIQFTKNSFGIFDIIDPFEAANKDAKDSPVVLFKNKKGSSYISGGISINSNQFTRVPHWAVYLQYKPKNIPFYFESEYMWQNQGQIAINISNYFSGSNELNTYQNFSVAYQIKGKNTIEKKSQLFSSTSFKTSFGVANSTVPQYFYVDSENTTRKSTSYSGMISIVGSTISNYTLSSMELGIGFLNKEIVLTSDRETFAVASISLKLGLAHLL